MNLNNENDKNSVANSITWPEWKIRVEKILISDQTITYLTKKNSINDTIFDPLAFKLSDISLNATDLKYNPKNINTQINLLTFKESSGFEQIWSEICRFHRIQEALGSSFFHLPHQK